MKDTLEKFLEGLLKKLVVLLYNTWHLYMWQVIKWLSDVFLLIMKGIVNGLEWCISYNTKLSHHSYDKVIDGKTKTANVETAPPRRPV